MATWNDTSSKKRCYYYSLPENTHVHDSKSCLHYAHTASPACFHIQVSLLLLLLLLLPAKQTDAASSLAGFVNRT